MGEIVKQNGNVRDLLVYKLALRISLITDIFVQRFIPRGSRTVDQMQQAARSCKQNIVEGSEAAPTSKETEIKLTNVARASLGELEEDYRDYLLFHHLTQWEKDHPRIIKLRNYLKSGKFDLEYKALCNRLPAEEYCNLAITLIRQAQYLLDRLIRSQEQRFLREGGIREAMTRARLKHRNSQDYQGYQNNQSYRDNQNYQGNQSYRSNQSYQNPESDKEFQ